MPHPQFPSRHHVRHQILSVRHVGRYKDPLRQSFEGQVLKQVFGVEYWQLGVGDDRLADDLSLELLIGVQLWRILVHFDPVGVDEVVDNFLPKIPRNLRIPLKSLRQKPGLISS